MNKILVFSGSTSKNSINKQLANYAASILQSTQFNLVDLNDFPVPLFSVDMEKESGFPENAKKFDSLTSECSGIILSLAEHNGSYTAAFKNLFDWLSRINSKTWKKKPMLLLSTSPGARGGKNVMEAALIRFPFHDAGSIEHFSMPYFNDNFSKGKVSHKALNEELHAAVKKFEAHIKNE